MTGRKIQRADLIAGLVVTALGFGALFQSLRMPRFEERNADPLTLPGITPGILGIVLGLLGVLLTLRAVMGLKPAAGGNMPIGTWPPGSARRTLLTVLMVGIYGFALFGRVDFLPATVLFIFVFTVVAEVINADRQVSMVKVLVGSLVLALMVAFILRFVFVDIFMIRLPG